MSTEGTGVAAGPVILIALSIAALLLGASVMPSLGDQSPGASVTSPEVGDGEELDPVGPDSADGQGEELDIDGVGGDAGTVEPPEALLALGELLSPFALPMDLQGQGGGLELPEMAGDGSDDEGPSEDSMIIQWKAARIPMMTRRTTIRQKMSQLTMIRPKTNRLTIPMRKMS